MPDEKITTPPTPPINPPVTPPVKTDDDLKKMNSEELAIEVGRLRKVKEDFDVYKSKVDPVIETIWGDQDLLNKTIEVYNKKTGKVTTVDADKEGDLNKNQTVVDSDTRSAVVNQIYGDFENEVGITKMDDKGKQSTRGVVGTMLKEMLDPKGNKKDLNEVLKDVSLTKLPWYLRQIHKIVNRDNDIKASHEAGKNEILSQYEGERGSIGSMESGSLPTGELALTQKEKDIARKQHVSEEDYLKSKKEILSARSSY